MNEPQCCGEVGRGGARIPNSSTSGASRIGRKGSFSTGTDGLAQRAS